MDVHVYGLGEIDYGAVAVLYNLANTTVCDIAMSAKDPQSLVDARAEQKCEPSDMLIYRLFGGKDFQSMYTSRLPLLYFSSLTKATERSTAGNEDKAFDKESWAFRQRSAWARYDRARGGHTRSCSAFDSPFV